MRIRRNVIQNNEIHQKKPRKNNLRLARKEKFDFGIIDIQMSRKSGLNFIIELRNESPKFTFSVCNIFFYVELETSFDLKVSPAKMRSIVNTAPTKIARKPKSTI